MVEISIASAFEGVLESRKLHKWSRHIIRKPSECQKIVNRQAYIYTFSSAYEMRGFSVYFTLFAKSLRNYYLAASIGGSSRFKKMVAIWNGQKMEHLKNERRKKCFFFRSLVAHRFGRV